MKKESVKVCPSCKKETESSANFCTNCGAKLKADQSKPDKIEEGLINRANPYAIIGIAFILSLVIVFIILSDNRDILQQKINMQKPPVSNIVNPEAQNRLQQLNLGILENPDDYDLNVEIANNYFDTRDFQKAVTHYKQALLIQDGDPNVMIDLGVSYFNLNQADSALHIIQKALGKKPDHIQGLFNAGVIHYNLGNTEAAIESWELLIKSHAESEEASRAMQFIRQVKEQLNKS